MRLLLCLSVCVGFCLVATDAQEYSISKADSIGRERAQEDLEASEPAIRSSDLELYLERLVSEEFAGRLPGQAGERMATTYFAEFVEQLGLIPAGENDTYYQELSFARGKTTSKNNQLTIIDADGSKRVFKPGDVYQPIATSSSGKANASMVFVGYGVDAEAYDNYKDLDVEGKWVVVLRGVPETKPELHNRYGALYRKAHIAKQKGAKGIVYIKAGNPAVGSELVPPNRRIGPNQTIIPSITITDKLAITLFKDSKMSDSTLKQIFDHYNKGEDEQGFPLTCSANAEIDLIANNIPYRNVLGRLVVGDQPSEQAIYIGAHIDHLGHGQLGGTFARGEEAKKLHPGADDNGSGTVALLELAHYFANQKKKGELDVKRDIVFVAFSAEELGIFGSREFIAAQRKKYDNEIYPRIAAFINLDMIGRAATNNDGSVSLHGTDSSYDWRDIIDQISPVDGLTIKQIADPNKPADSQSFYLAGVPTLFAHTEGHPDYHTPADTIDKIDFDGLTHITKYLSSMLSHLAARSEPPSYAFSPRNAEGAGLINGKLGVRVKEDADSEKLSVAEVLKDSVAERSGLQRGDVIRRLNERGITSRSSLIHSLSLMKYGGSYPVEVERKGEVEALEIALPDRRIPWDDCFIQFQYYPTQSEHSDERLSISVGVRQSPGSSVPQFAKMVTVSEFSSIKSVSEAEQKLFIKATSHAMDKKPFKDEMETRSNRVAMTTSYESIKVDDESWQVRITRGKDSIVFEASEANQVADAIAEADRSIAWLKAFVDDVPIKMAKPKSSRYRLDATVGTVMTSNKKLGIKVSVRRLSENTVSFSLLYGNRSSTSAAWVKELVEEMGNAFDAVAQQKDYEAKVSNHTITADLENQTVMVEGVRGRSKVSGKFTQSDYEQIQSLIEYGEEMSQWFTENEALFFTKTDKE